MHERPELLRTDGTGPLVAPLAVDLEALFALLRRERSVIPFVGAGLAAQAGAPSSAQLAAELAERCGVPPGSLGTVTTLAEARHGADAVRRVVANIVGAAQPRPTPALLAVAANRTRRVLTTNYDDAIERAARAVGREPLTLRTTDARLLSQPPPGVVHVVHLHGVATDPASIVLPGDATLKLTGDEPFALAARALMAQHLVLYLGFRLGPSEVHLRSTVAWLASQITQARRHVLLVQADERDARGEELQTLADIPIVDVVAYSDPAHGPVVQAALLLWPTAEPNGEQATLVTETPPDPFVIPALVTMGPRDELRSLEYRLRDIEQGREPFIGPEQLVARGRALVVAGPGMGKTELLRLMARSELEAPALLAELPTLAGLLEDENDPLRAVTRLLGAARSGLADTPRATARALDESAFVFLLDGLDEVASARRGAVAQAVVAAAERWPQHRWVLATRPDAEILRLSDEDFGLFRILPSAAWARKYLEVNAVPPERVRQATLDHPEFEVLLGIPLYARIIADRLRADQSLPGTVLELLEDAQRRAVTEEAAKRGLDAGELFGWLERVAVGLELTGRGDAPVAELAGIPAVGELSSLALRERLVRASLLADLPERAAFPRRTVQELLCARAILATADPALTLSDVAVAEVDGRLVLRDDTDFTVDLVFEAATRPQRAALRALDEQRWARTVSLDNSDETRDALDVLWRRQDELGLAAGWFGEGALRGSLAAMARICARWPQLVDERRDALHADLAGDNRDRRLNAMRLLGLGDRDPILESALPQLVGESGRVGAMAVALTGRLKVRAAVPALRDALDRESESRRDLLRTLIELLDDPAEIATELVSGRIRGHEAYDVSGLLAEKLNVDVTLQVVRGPWLDARLTGWLLERLIDRQPDEVWDERRLDGLVLVLVDSVAFADVDERPALGAFAARHGGGLVAAARRLLEMWPGRSNGWDFLDAVDPTLLEGPELDDLRAAVVRSRAARADTGRPPAPLTAEQHLRALLEALDGEADERLARLVQPVRWRVARVPERHRPRLIELVELWWPRQPMCELRPWRGEPDDACAQAAVTIGTALELPLSAERWLDLLDAPLMLEDVPDAYFWLSRSYVPELDPELLARVRRADTDRELSRLIAALPRGIALIEAVVDRLGDIAGGRGWGNAVGVLAQRGDRTVRRLLERDLSDEQRAIVLADLADAGDADAQVELLDRVIALPPDADAPRPHWHRAVTDPRVLERLGDLVIAAHDRHEGLASFAVGQLSTAATAEALAALNRVAAQVDRPSIAPERERVARRVASAKVIDRLPPGVAEAALVVDSLRP